MRPEALRYLYEVRQACGLLVKFTAGKSFADYETDDMLRSATERQFEIIGEALNQLHKLAPDVADRISDRKRIVAFRNILIHRYAIVDNAVVWGILQANLPSLQREVTSLLPDETA